MELLAQFFDIVLHLDQHLKLLVENYGVWVYLILFLIIYCETGLVVTPFLPGDSLLFVAGFSTVFIALGASASVIGGVLRAYSHALSILAGVAIIVMGLHFLGLTPIALLAREKRTDASPPIAVESDGTVF